jgi:transcriptional regulator with XRE-family HTH domain
MMSDERFYRFVGGKIRELRTAAGETQAEIAKVIRRASNVICLIERGVQRATVRDVVLLAAHFHVKPHVFFPKPFSATHQCTTKRGTR